MSAGSTLRRQRAKLTTAQTRRTSRPASEQPVVALPGVMIPAGPAPLCHEHGRPMVYVACRCHPENAGWQCGELSLSGHMVRVR